MGFQQVFYLEYAAVDKVTPVSNKVTNKVTANNKKISGSFASMSGSSMKSLRQLNSVFNVTANAAVASATAIVGFMAKSTADTSMMIDSFKNQMLVYTGSVEGANKEWEKAIDMADRTGMSLTAITGTYGKFAVAAKSAGLEQEMLTGIYEEFGKASVAMGLSQENVKLSLKAVEQMFSKGTVAAEELKSQLGEHFPDAMGMAARSMGLTTGELMKFMKNGKVLASELLPKMAKQMREELGEASKLAATQLRSSLNRLDASFIKLKESVIKLGTSDLMKKFVDNVSESLNIIANLIDTKLNPALAKLRSEFKKFIGGEYTDAITKSQQYQKEIEIQNNLIASATQKYESLKQIYDTMATRLGADGLTSQETTQLKAYAEQLAIAKKELEGLTAVQANPSTTMKSIVKATDKPESKKDDIFGGVKTGESSLSGKDTGGEGGASTKQTDFEKMLNETMLEANEMAFAREDEVMTERYQKKLAAEKEFGDMLNAVKMDSAAMQFEYEMEVESERMAKRKELEEQKQQEINDIIAGKMNERLGIQEHGFGAITNLVAKSGSEQAGLMASAFGSMIASSASFSKKAFKLQQGLAIANAVVKGYEAVQGAYAFGNNIGGPPLGAAMAAAALVNTVSRIRAIKSQSFGGSSTVSSGSTSSASASTSGVASNNNATLNTATGEVTPTSDQVVKIELQGEVFNKEQVRELISSINDVLDEGYTLRV